VTPDVAVWLRLSDAKGVANGTDAGCGSQSLLRLSRILGGTIESELSFSFATSAYAVSDDVRALCPQRPSTTVL
jgi:hypothetical protein